MSKNCIDDALDGGGGVDDDPVLWLVFFCPVEPHHEVPGSWLSAPLVIRPGVETRLQRLKIDLKKEDAIEEIYEPVVVPGTAAKERSGVTLARYQSSDLFDVPDMMPVGKALRWFTGLWVALIGQDPVTMDDLVTTPFKRLADSGFSGAGNAFDQVVLNAHIPFPLERHRPSFRAASALLQHTER